MSSSNWVQHQRDTERKRREASRAAGESERERLRTEAESWREGAWDREGKQDLAEARAREVQWLNDDLRARLVALQTLLSATLATDDTIDIARLKVSPTTPQFDAGGLDRPLQRPASLTTLRALVPGAKQRHADAMEQFHADEQARERELAARRAAHEQDVAAIRDQAAAQDAEVDAFAAAYAAGEPDAVVTYSSMVLAASRYPHDFPQQHKVAYVPESRQLVVETDVPPIAVVPEQAEYRYVKSKDEIAAKAMPAAQRRKLYASVVAQVALRTVHELFEADRGGHLESIVVNGHVDAVDPRTGQPIRPCLVTLRTTRDVFDGLDLGHVEPEACLRGLSASVSKSPAELTPVRPVLEFSMVDHRFVEEADVLSGLDQRANLMELTPGEFEALITNLFERMGLETRMTQASRDGGVDCVAFDPRPIFGGKVVIQAKRYKHTVGVSAVRDLFGTMQNEGASKGILVTTSGYGKASFEFAEGKPLELLSGSNLLYLLEEHAGMEAKIEPPDDWVDPAEDVG
ncbi:MAG: restriction endonuclease [Solirubrobacterales bacterium]|nr:restriction endonuclease [Solirubrobacterales bacterium]